MCIDHLSKEIVKHHEKLLDDWFRIVRRDPEDETGPDQMFVGGCLPLVAVSLVVVALIFFSSLVGIYFF